MSDLIELRAKFRSFISHATGGRFHEEDCPDLPLNTLSVAATAKVNDVWNHALEKGREESAARIRVLEEALRYLRHIAGHEALEEIIDKALGDAS